MIDWVGAVSRRFRRRRMERFAREFRIGSRTRILDVGGVPETWRGSGWESRITLLNMPRTSAEIGGGRWVAGDGRALPFRDGAFDIVFSNSVIEHVGDADSQERFAREVARVGRGYWVQTPNRWFPVEQHLLTPFIHWLPKRWQRAVAQRWTVWDAVTRASRDRREFYLEHYLSQARLLGPAEMRRFFPGARLIRERVCGLTKSLVAIKSRH